MKSILSLFKFVLPLFVASACVMLVSACGDDNDEPLMPEVPTEEPVPTEVNITVPENVTVSQFSSTTVTVTLSGNYTTAPEWTCTSANTSVATAQKIDASSMSVTGVSAGQTDVSVDCSVGEEKFSKKFKVTVESGVVKILAIGNSFSQDAVEQYLYEVANSAGIEVVIGNMYIGGCDLDKHLNNMKNDAAAYSYRKIVKGNKTTREKAKISEVLADEKWNYISLQQASGKSGKYDTYNALGELITNISAAVPEATLVWHQTWAYASTSNHAVGATA